MSESPAPLHRRRTPRRTGEVVDPQEDLARFSDLMDRFPVDAPNRGFMEAHRAELTERVLGPNPKLDLHLEGAGVDGHTTDASPLGNFLRSLDNAAKAIARSLYGLSQLTGSLRVTPTLGSVRLLIEPPGRPLPANSLRVQRLEQVETTALRRIVSLMEVAEKNDDPVSSELDAALHDLNSKAREALARFARVTKESAYELRGSWTDPKQGKSTVLLSLSAASRLEHAAGDTTKKVEEVSAVGEVDGWEWSSSTVRFAPRQGKTFRASVPENLAPTVAKLIASRGTEVNATFAVVTSYKRGSDQPGRKGYALQSVDAVDAAQPFPDF